MISVPVNISAEEFSFKLINFSISKKSSLILPTSLEFLKFFTTGFKIILNKLFIEVYMDLILSCLNSLYQFIYNIPFRININFEAGKGPDKIGSQFVIFLVKAEKSSLISGYTEFL